ncbi:hypothetical protein GALMADRAFT_234605 [Galerina marginata CBS 339.88]|uniref:Uncharacterized protein n=1 Tax=Galerina marginata (strain CBS 339.88) TaxID=685588 RepID=A0A067U2K0_GALM3|nr:hypothetical protein GALMADRAFT_234605 [Galerina marginata CBS 339.88]
MSLENAATEGTLSSVTEGSPGQGKKGVAPRTLIISPNLDALLEHEERKRGGGEPRSPESYSHSSPQSLSPSTEYGMGLPPPPRRTRGPKSPLTGIARRGSVVSTVGQEEEPPSSTSNPYINPAPTLEDVFLAGIGTTMSATEKRGHSRDGSVTALPSPQQPSKTQNIEEHAQGLRKSTPQRKFVKHDMNGDGERNNASWRRRPLISHGHHSSVSSSESSCAPPSTIERDPRISISSTIYPASSAHSHPQSLYNEPTFDMATQYRNSFIEIYSPTNPEFNLDHNSPVSNASHPLSPLQFSGSPVSEESYAIDRRSISPKPPIPTTPKPMFTRAALKSRQSSPMPPPSPPIQNEHKFRDTPLPPTTNFLDVEERADLVRKTRKLARVFGQTPGADAMAQQDTNTLSNKPRWRGGMYTFDDSKRLRPGPFNLSNARRHSMPLTPDDVSFLIVSPTFETTPSRADFQIGTGSQEGLASSDLPSHHQIRSGSPTSFIDLSDEEANEARGPRKPAEKAPDPVPSSPVQSLLETMSIDDRVEDERRRKRERLAKLHRFLGSRVPANLVLGFEDIEASLPPPQQSPRTSSESEDTSRKAWLRRRRSSSVVIPSSRWSDELERVKEELDDKEKAINVRRAQKMEKVFGVAPPQTLYHTRHCPSPTSLPPAKSLPPLPPVSPITPISPATTTQRITNFNRSAYIKPKTKKNGRPGTSESSKQLLPKGSEIPGFDERTANADARHSLMYNHYQHSLNSLNDIIDRDDRESLAELHQYLNNPETIPIPIPTPQPEEDIPSAMDRRTSVASTIKSERRRSLPARTSMISLASSEFSVTTPKADVTTFQVRRRRAAKLTQFFGVNYRELITDVLESIENGVEHEHQRGTLRAEEVEDLLSKLRNLKAKT